MITSCSELSLNAQEPLIGTASPKSRLIFVSCNPEQLASAPDPKQEYRLYIDPSAGDGVNVRMHPEEVMYRNIPIDQLEALISSHIEGGPLFPSEPIPRPSIYICVHGGHDVCCGRQGPVVLEAVKKHAGEDIDVFGCSHLGGHRFAATGVCMPSGLMYGRLSVVDADALVESVRRNSVLTPRLRGRAWLSIEDQIKEYESLTGESVSRDRSQFTQAKSCRDIPTASQVV
jgi:hypothetical protein